MKTFKNFQLSVQHTDTAGIAAKAGRRMHLGMHAGTVERRRRTIFHSIHSVITRFRFPGTITVGRPSATTSHRSISLLSLSLSFSLIAMASRSNGMRNNIALMP